MNKETIQKVAELQVTIYSLGERLKELHWIIEQLSKDKCKVTFCFKMRNEDQQVRNDLQLQVDMANAQETLFGPLYQKTPMPPVNIYFDDAISEPLAIRMLNFMYQEEMTKQTARIDELNKLLNPNPILSLHTTTH